MRHRLPPGTPFSARPLRILPATCGRCISISIFYPHRITLTRTDLIEAAAYEVGNHDKKYQPKTYQFNPASSDGSVVTSCQVIVCTCPCLFSPYTVNCADDASSIVEPFAACTLVVMNRGSATRQARRAEANQQSCDKLDQEELGLWLH